MVIFGHEVPDVMLVKVAIVLGIAAIAGAYEGWTGNRFFRSRRPQEPQKPPEPVPGVVKDMGMVEEVPQDQRRP
jgi:hypothetical protein